MIDFNWPVNFPDEQLMLELLQKTAKSSWRNENIFSSDDIQKWLSNFSGKVYDIETERRLALWLLCNFTYYNEDECSHLCRVVFKKFLHIIATTYGVKDNEDLRHLFDNIYFAAMGNPSESGGMLLYYFRQQSNLSISKFYYPSVIPKDRNGIVVFVDDVTLSGGSASKFFQRNLNSMEYDSAYYLTLFASSEAVSVISKQGIKVIEATILGDRERCFTEKSLIFADFPELKEPSLKIATGYGKKIMPGNPLGHKNGQYCFGLYYNTPNNTLPIFWSNKKWIPIFPRKEKNNNDWQVIDYDRFI